MSGVSVICPSCFEEFEVAAPHPGELPCDVDYDCEICCRPMRIAFADEDGDVQASAYGLADNGPWG